MNIDKEFTRELKKRLLIEFKKQDRSGIYAVTSRMLAYNSNRIEGSTLSEDQTADLFETGCLPASNDVYRAKDIEEMNGHFLMFNKMLQTLDEPLSETMIKEFHYNLKAGVFEDRANGYNIGEYKSRANIAGTMTTSLPEQVPRDMKNLLIWYHKQNVDIAVLAVIHARYEKIHPFQDGNGRTGRIILFRESLVHDIVPPIIEDKNRLQYINSIKEYDSSGSHNSLLKLLVEEQDVFKGIAAPFLDSKPMPVQFTEIKNRKSGSSQNKKNMQDINI